MPPGVCEALAVNVTFVPILNVESLVGLVMLTVIGAAVGAGVGVGIGVGVGVGADETVPSIMK